MESRNNSFLKSALILITIFFNCSPAIAAGEHDCIYNKGFPKVLSLKSCSNCMCVGEVLCKTQTGKDIKITTACPSKMKSCPDADSCLLALDHREGINYYATVKNTKGEYDFDYDEPTPSARPYNDVKRLDLWLNSPELKKPSVEKKNRK